MFSQKLIAIFTLLCLAVSASPLLSRDIFDDFNVFSDDSDNTQSISNNGQNTGNSVENSGTVFGDFNVKQSAKACGNAQLNCCNSLEQKGDTVNAGLLASLFGSGDVGIQCSPMNIAVVGAQVPVNKACDAKAACCQGESTQNGLINLGCIALASLI